MKNYNVTYSINCTMIVRAENEDQARQHVREMKLTQIATDCSVNILRNSDCLEVGSVEAIDDTDWAFEYEQTVYYADEEKAKDGIVKERYSNNCDEQFYDLECSDGSLMKAVPMSKLSPF